MDGVKKQSKSLGELLIQGGFINKEQLADALKDQVAESEPLGKILVKKGYVKESDIINMLEGLLVVICEVNKELFGVEVIFAKEILKYKKITSLPSLPPYIMGMLSLRDEVVPVVSINKKVFGIDDVITDDTRIIITDIKEEKVGMLVDNVVSVKNFDSTKFQNINQYSLKVEKKYIAGIIKDDTMLVTLLKPEAIIGKDR